MAEGDITLHPKLGVNPRMTICVRCGGDGRELVLLGERNYVTTCPHCGINAIGSKPSEKCPKCGKKMAGGKKRELGDHEKIPAGLCEKCEKEVEESKGEIQRGGVHVKCKCGMTGVIKAYHPMAKEARDHFNLHNGEPCGVEVDRCPLCEKGHDRQTGKANESVGDAGQVP